jgi:hypothetical protein
MVEALEKELECQEEEEHFAIWWPRPSNESLFSAEAHLVTRNRTGLVKR